MKKIYSLFLFVLLLLLTACDSGTSNGDQTSTPTPRSGAIAHALLQHEPSGDATLNWDATKRALKVQINLSGLGEGSTHPLHIHGGNCNSQGVDLYTLKDIVADAHGSATSTATISDVMGGIPDTGWYIEVQKGSGDQATSMIACGNITNAQPSVQDNQTAHVQIAEVPQPDQSSSGLVQLSVAHGSLTVVITMNGLSPQSAHAAQIATGSCRQQGKQLNVLQPVVADDTGNGSSTTTLPNVTAIPGSGWHVTIALSSDGGADTDIIACGDIVAGALG
ncbi:CHRD domain-containing protein [Tengunoibacter tsumagoiensis]|uniref:CHRD domain-containing protein n=1 Tax=Tengunoibacter tsumagoiensis TaxID=2014871 RepID=A0A402A6J6_9CHLR|nr:CHRD domain-containing protein [Tengunoibacter tsumagoiensis]GCE14767.1 hypothetical protein KTT_46260 [Tengunoibacter tsumagoiensis]